MERVNYILQKDGTRLITSRKIEYFDNTLRRHKRCLGVVKVTAFGNILCIKCNSLITLKNTKILDRGCYRKTGLSRYNFIRRCINEYKSKRK